MPDDPIQAFIRRWTPSGGAELPNYVSFLKELCGVLEVDHPLPTVPDESQNAYVFEKAVDFDNHDGTRTTRRIDQSAAVQAAFTAPATVEEVAAKFLNSKKNTDRIEELLDTLVSLGKARELKNARFLTV